MHINDLSTHELQQEIALFTEQRQLALGLGMTKAGEQHRVYLDALWGRLNAIDPVPTVTDEDALLAELLG